MTGAPITIWTVGHGSRELEDLVLILDQAGIACLADVRAFPISRRHPQFSRERLEARLRQYGIRYLWLGKALGGFRKAAPGSPHTALAGRAFQGYADYMLTSAFRQGIEALATVAANCPTAVMCAERDPAHCHRSLIADYWVALGPRLDPSGTGFQAIHLLAPDRRQPHRLNPAARLEGGQLVYDREAAPELPFTE